VVLLDFQFKKATRQPIKPHEIKIAKKERARLITQYWEIYSGREICHNLT
jgi:ribosomal protein L29